MLSNMTYNITGVEIIDNIFTIVVKCMLAYFLVVAIGRSIKLFRDGNYPQLFIAGFASLIILAFIIGINNVVTIGKSFINLFPNSSGGSGPQV